MNKRLSIVLLLACVFASTTNHLIIDWKGLYGKKAIESFEDLIVQQHDDLVEWKNGRYEESLFRKRTICNGRLENWSDNRPFVSHYLSDSVDVITNEQGIFLVQRINEDHCTYISCLQLYAKYSITNQYLEERQTRLLHKDVTGISIVSGDVSYKGIVFFEVNDMASNVVDSIIFILIMVVLLLEYWKFSQINIKSFAVATSVLLFIRYLSLQFEVFQLVTRFDLFDPVKYHSSFANPTMGDLFINCLLLNLVVVAWSKYAYKLKRSSSGAMILSGANTALSGLVLHVAWTIISNSQLSLDVSQSIEFDLLRIVAYLCIVFACVAYFYFTYLTLSVIRKGRRMTQAIVGSLIIVVIMALLDILSVTFSVAHISIIVLSSRYQWGRSFKDFTYSNLLFILLVSGGISAVLAFCIYKYEEDAILDSKKKFANYLLLKRDVLGEYYLDQTVKKLNSDEGLETMASERSKIILENHIKSKFLTPYFNKYELSIIFQDFQQLAFDTRFSREYSLLLPENQSDYENIYFIDEGTNFKYICKVNIGELVGLIVLQIKKRVPTSVYPALLTDNKYFSITNDFDYAVFVGDQILFHRSKFGQGEWPQKEDFDRKALYRKGIEKNERHYYGVKTTDGRTILIISKKYEAQDRLTNFSFFFLLLLFAFSLFSMTSSFMAYGPKLNFTSKIQLYLGLAFVIPLLITGFALLNTLNRSYRDEINRSYIKQSLYISEILSDEIQQEVSEEELDAYRLGEISSYIQSDISFFNASGYLVATSQPEIFNLNLQSNLINPVVFEELIRKENQSTIANEAVGGLEYKVCYAVVNSADHEIAGFIAMPFFDSRNHLRRQQIEVFGNLLIIFGFMFIIAIVFGNVVLNNLLHPLRMVAAKIRKVTLQDVNKPIEYKSSDEIGSLVKDYNQMLVKLEDSKKALARSQKETAWKEIAKQVAHEIKNPLTPMQLKIQQMLRKHENDSKEFETLSSLLTQVDTLSQIAQSFSAFAEMPAPDNQVFEWAAIVREVIELYSSKEVAIEMDLEEKICIDADKDIFRRILNNIVLNAIQSVQNKEAKIAVKLTSKSGKAILSIRDNGKGIPEELKDKIFLNYFSTKSTGSGIGLALAKKGIENAGGNIWFESNQEAGTTFYISMPLCSN